MSGARQISFEDAPFSAIHKKITAGTFMGQISDGYTLGIVGISLNYAMEPLGLTSFWMGLIGAGSMFGIFFGSLLAGITADKIGRRPLYASLMLLTAIVSVLQFFLSDPLLIAIVRFVLGMLIGADYTVGIPLLSEWAPAKKRAGILGWLLVFWTIGYCISYIVGFFMDGFVAAFGNDGWRLVLCTSVVPSLIALVIRFGTPESPCGTSPRGALRKLSPTSMPISATSMDCLIAERKSPLPLRGSRCSLLSSGAIRWCPAYSSLPRCCLSLPSASSCRWCSPR